MTFNRWCMVEEQARSTFYGMDRTTHLQRLRPMCEDPSKKMSRGCLITARPGEFRADIS